jgi:hypothetical protein
LQERRQHLLQRLPLEVIEEDFGHRPGFDHRS